MANTNDETRLIVRLRSESNDNSVQFSPLSKSWNPSELKDISSLAKWSLSSNKEAFGVDRLHDGNLDTYWQLSRVLLNHCDESYTPRQIALRVGNRVQDLYQISQLELNEPSGWIDILVSDPDKP
ncbi:hypothetical protein BDEG_25243 [Batrachochytrium dendrobatidis JEL423]|uniref:DOC domain-containing protein n=1 Tax=Batrachochytrium dendrobatidis (strain JEL423) TaxID=403673 RepID=A0A177WNL3_BATDL|nr:hypothetical protein BDEG_25243 [Batrachochytrium dendrobatidis JEL423]